MKDKKQSANYIRIWIGTAILVCITALMLFFYFSYIKTLTKNQNVQVYDKYYVMITEEPSSSFWRSIYKAACETAEQQNAYVEMLSDRISQNYSTEELMEIAIASGADGIIISADESDKMTDLINEASANNIPVVTLLSDNTQSERISYVGVGNYNLGLEYGKLISEISAGRTENKGAIKAVVLVDANSRDSGQNVSYSAIQDSVAKDNASHSYTHSPIQVSLYAIDGTNEFSVEESVRSIFRVREEDFPDIVVCLNETDTTSIYQTVVDYNEVGRVNILGYYDSEAILKGIDRHAIYATISVDTNQLGQFCIDALTEYHEFGNTSQYFTADISVISQINIDDYINKEGNDEE